MRASHLLNYGKKFILYAFSAELKCVCPAAAAVAFLQSSLFIGISGDRGVLLVGSVTRDEKHPACLYPSRAQELANETFDR
jgi:hypothetical protein